MPDEISRQAIKRHWERENLSEVIRAALIASGNRLEALTLDNLAPFDQFHRGGKRFTERLARLAGLTPHMHVLDVGGGLGGPARTLAVEFGCRVTVVDLTESYLHAARMLTSLMKLEERVAFQLGDATDLPFDDGSFDAVWTQNSGMNIADKEKLYAGFRRLIRPNGLLAIQEPVAGPSQPPILPLMWSPDGRNNFVRTPDQLRATIEAAGFELIQWDDVTHGAEAADAPRPANNIQQLVMGAERLAEITRAAKRNEDEGRVGMVQAVFRRPPDS